MEEKTLDFSKDAPRSGHIFMEVRVEDEETIGLKPGSLWLNITYEYRDMEIHIRLVKIIHN